MEANKSANAARHQGFLTRLRDLVFDRRGVGAVEFALIAPLLLSLYITSFEITIGLSMAKRVTRSASTIADLITRENSVDKTLLTTMTDVANSLFAPYAANNLKIKVTGVALDPAGNATVAWSWDQSNGKPYAVGAPVNVPIDMRTPNSFLVHSEVSVDHQLMMLMSNVLANQTSNITISRDYFFRPRMGSSVACTNC
jgi:Flp pilus assembly protein TadG